MSWNRKGLMVAAAGAAMASMVGAAGTASAMGLPNSYHYEQRLDRGQFGTTDVFVDHSGVATVTTRFTNAKPGDRDRFFARVIFRDRAGRPVASLEQQRVLDGAFRGRSSEARVVDYVRLVRPQWAQVHSIDVQMRTDDRGDRDHGGWDRSGWDRGGPDRRWQEPPQHYDLPGERPVWRGPDNR